MSISIKCCLPVFNVEQFLGLWLHPSGVLAASPDGLVITAPSYTVPLHFQNQDSCCFDPYIIEVKCPYSAKDLFLKDAKLDFIGKYTVEISVTVNMYYSCSLIYFMVNLTFILYTGLVFISFNCYLIFFRM